MWLRFAQILPVGFIMFANSSLVQHLAQAIQLSRRRRFLSARFLPALSFIADLDRPTCYI